MASWSEREAIRWDEDRKRREAWAAAERAASEKEKADRPSETEEG